MEKDMNSLEYLQSKENYDSWRLSLHKDDFIRYFPTLKYKWKSDKEDWKLIMYDMWNERNKENNDALNKAAKKYKKSVLKEYYNVDDMKDWWNLDLTEMDKLEDDSKIKPQHYKSNNDVIQFCLDNKLSFCEANVVKYVVRWKKKNGIEDLKKAIEYINRLIKYEQRKLLKEITEDDEKDDIYDEKYRDGEGY
jgi:hypothetical protein